MNRFFDLNNIEKDSKLILIVYLKILIAVVAGSQIKK